VHVHATKLGAAMQRRENLTWIEQPLVVERAFKSLLLIEVGLGEHRRHQVALLDADAMLASEHAADFDAELEDIGTEGTLAEREGFEPPIRLPVCRISSAVLSTTQPPLQTLIYRKNFVLIHPPDLRLQTFC
jgi:hypothetical protein